MSTDVTIVIQGQTTYCKDIIKNISKNFNYIWSTWENEPEKNLNLIKNNMELVVSKLPKLPGTNNVNYQMMSSFEGIKKVKTKYAFKTRGDMIFSNFESLMEKIVLNNKELSFLHYSLDPAQIADFFSFGSVENQLALWNGEERLAQSPEKTIQENYMINKKYSESYEALIKRFYFFRSVIGDNGIDIGWLKWPRCTLSCWMNESHDGLYPKREDYPQRKWPCISADTLKND